MSYRSIGCFADSEDDRVLTGLDLISKHLTNEMCAKICAWSGEYPYFGTGDSDKCYCGILADEYSRLGEDLCDEECYGNSSQICGGVSAFSAFEYFTPFLVHTSGLEYEWLGCFVDSSLDRVLSGPRFDYSPGLTVRACAEVCASLGGFEIFGVENGNQCFCGHSTDQYDIFGHNDSLCFDCEWNTTETCGGRDAIDMYTYTELPIPPEISFKSIGCYQDSEDHRVLTGPSLINDELLELTNDMCASICGWSGKYLYFGIEDSNECYCGIQTDQYSRLGEGGCNLACAGNSTQTCGGISSLLAFEYVAPSLSSSDDDGAPVPSSSSLTGEPTGSKFSRPPTRSPVDNPSPSPSKALPPSSGEPSGSKSSGPPTRSPVDNPSPSPSKALPPSSGEPTGSKFAGPPTRSPVDNPSPSPSKALPPSSGGGEGSIDSGNDSSFLWEILITIVAGLALMAVTWLLKKLTRFNCAEAVSVWTAHANVSRSGQSTHRATV
ncbi:unnamed protein product [Ascophyllum nodosum]